MFDAAPYRDQLDDQQPAVSIDTQQHLHRIKTDYGFRNEIRKDLMDTLKSIFSTKRPKNG